MVPAQYSSVFKEISHNLYLIKEYLALNALSRLLGFVPGNRAPKIDSTSVSNACELLKGPKCCVLEGSPL